MTSKLIGHYCRMHWKFYGLLCLLGGTIIFIPLAITSLCYDVLENDILIAFTAAYCPCLLVFVIIAGWNLRFVSMIQRQERLFGVTFSDERAEPLWRDAISFLSRDWFIHAGSAAFYKDYITGISFAREIPGQNRGGYHLIIQTTDGRGYRLFIRTRSGCEKVRRWWKENRKISEERYGL